MHIEFVGRHLTVTAKQKAHAMEYLERIVPIVPQAVSARIILTAESYRKIAEVELVIPNGDLVASCEGTDMDQLIHDALRRIEQQAVKHNQREKTLRDHRKPVTTEDVDARGITEALNAQ